MEEKYKTYVFNYPYKGQTWGFDIKATSPEDAQARLKALAWAEYDGELGLVIEVPMGNWLLKFWNWLTGRP
jgi:hypothetical protein